MKKQWALPASGSAPLHFEEICRRVQDRRFLVREKGMKTKTDAHPYTPVFGLGLGANDNRLLARVLKQTEGAYWIPGCATMDSVLQAQRTIVIANADQQGVMLSKLVARHPFARVVCVAEQWDREAVFEAIRAGAFGCLTSPLVEAEIEALLPVVALDGTYVSPIIDLNELPAGAGLSLRERQVMELVAEGKTDKAIAAYLGIAYYTVKEYLKNVYRKLGVQSRAAAVTALRQRSGHET